jgi:signal transduction histidine kinase
MKADGRLTELAVAARRAVAAEAVVLTEETSAGRELIAAEGIPEGGLRAFRGMLRAAAPAGPDRAMTLTVLRRDRGGFENVGLVEAFARHAALTVQVGTQRAEGGSEPECTAADAVAVHVLAAADIEELSQVLARGMALALGARTAGLFLLDEREGLLDLAPGSFGTGREESAGVPEAVVDWASCAGRVFATGHPYLANDAARDPGMLREYVGYFELGRVLTVPLETGGRRIGVLQIADKQDPFTVDDVRAAMALAPAVARAVQQARARFDLQRRHRLEEILSSVAVDIASGKDLQDFLATAVDDICDAIGASSIALVPADGDPVIWRRASGNEKVEHILLADAQHVSTVRSFTGRPRRAGAPGWAVVHVPVLLTGERAGTLSALRLRGAPFGRDERRALSRLSSFVALAWATEGYQRRRAELARADERDRISEELHDHAAQLLYAARLALESVHESPELPAGLSAELERVNELLVRGDAAVRDIIDRLSQRGPPDFPERLAEVASGIEDEFRRTVELDISNHAVLAAERLSPHARNLLAKVAREALVNAAKHAGPCRLSVSVSLTRRRRLLLSVSDDGIGVAARRRSDGFGLASTRRAVRRQGGALRVHARPAGGTTVVVSLPL